MNPTTSITWTRAGGQWVARLDAKHEARIIQTTSPEGEPEFIVRVGHKRRGATLSCSCPTLEVAQREGLALLQEFTR